MNKIIGKIADISLIKEGETEGRTWNLYKVIINGKTFTTFDSGFKELVGKEGEWEYDEKEVESGGEIYTRRTLKFPKQKEIEKIAKETAGSPSNGIIEALKKVYMKLEEIDKNIKNLKITDIYYPDGNVQRKVEEERKSF